MRNKLPTTLFGRRLREAREKTGLPQDKLGVLIGLDEGCSSARISRYETGLHEPPFETAEKLAEALNVPTAFLYCKDDELANFILLWDGLSQTEKAQIQKFLGTLTSLPGPPI